MNYQKTIILLRRLFLICVCLISLLILCGAAKPGFLYDPNKYSADEMTGRVAFIRLARGQLRSKGEIIGGEDGEYYSRWYVGGEYSNGWSEDTPWCGVFVSWAASQDDVKDYLQDFKTFASVEKGMELFTDGTNGTWLNADEKPLPGDLIFFDWEEEGDEDHGKPDHVGIITRIDKEAGTVSTIEGNCDGEVKEQTYTSDDPRIMGYGVLGWK